MNINKVLVTFTLISAALLSQPPARAAAAQETVTGSLFTISELQGPLITFAEKGVVLAKPQTENDRLSSQQFVQLRIEKDGSSTFLLTHNNGTDEVPMLKIGNSLCFVTIAESHLTALYICLDRKNPDGSFLVIQTRTRPDLAGTTYSSVMQGKATPSLMFDLWLKSLK